MLSSSIHLLFQAVEQSVVGEFASAESTFRGFEGVEFEQIKQLGLFLCRSNAFCSESDSVFSWALSHRSDPLLGLHTISSLAPLVGEQQSLTEFTLTLPYWSAQHQKIERHYFEGNQALTFGRFAHAQAEAQRIKALRPVSSAQEVFIAKVASIMGDQSECLVHLHRALMKIDPAFDFMDAVWTFRANPTSEALPLAISLFERRFELAALRVLELAQKSRPLTCKELNYLATIQAFTGKLENAKSSFEAARSINATDTVATTSLNEISLIEARKFEDINTDYRDILGAKKKELKRILPTLCSHTPHTYEKEALVLVVCPYGAGSLWASSLLTRILPHAKECIDAHAYVEGLDLGSSEGRDRSINFFRDAALQGKIVHGHLYHSHWATIVNELSPSPRIFVMLRNPFDHVVSVTRWINGVARELGGFAPDETVSFQANIKKNLKTFPFEELYQETQLSWLEKSGAFPIYFEQLILEPYEVLASALGWLGISNLDAIPAAILAENYPLTDPGEGLIPFPRRISTIPYQRSDLGEWESYLDMDDLEFLQSFHILFNKMGYRSLFE